LLLGWFAEEVVEASGEVSFEAADGFFAGLAFGDLAVQVGARSGVALGAGDADCVKRPVELAIAAPAGAIAVTARIAIVEMSVTAATRTPACSDPNRAASHRPPDYRICGVEATLTERLPHGCRSYVNGLSLFAGIRDGG
jgi:hypothetical protein